MAALNDVPAVPGAYALLIELRRPARLAIASLGRPALPPGRYVYCGSARGPGGLRARIGRHLRRDKAVRWHVDHLTRRGRVLDVLALPDGDECTLAARIGGSRGSAVPIPGFGSSDCRQCRSHLLSVAAEFDLSRL
ncbi:MAG: GIY-YIG nuclease family protein [Alphaproteobacteria bacterium]|nr:GIY-YIG nuclease family protein [Alphaproteobacteria bacterium]MDP6812098.1 GIY-YIG nuclease family protein [Alphaproteobacteria bacterium]